MIPLFFNLSIALVAILVSAQATVGTFLGGFILGFLLLCVFRKIFGIRTYVRRMLAFSRFVPWFMKEFLQSNLAIAYAVVARENHELEPHFVTYDVSDLSEIEVFILSWVMSLTPGSVCAAISRDRTIMIVHVFHCPDEDEVRKTWDLNLRRRILEFTR